MCGDPPNIIIGTSLGYAFADFVSNTGFIAVISLIFVVLYFYFCFRKELSATRQEDGALVCRSPERPFTARRILP